MFSQIISYFQNLEQRPLERLAILVGGMLLLWIAEGAIPLIALKYRRNKLRHAAVNFSFTIFHLIIHTGFAVVIVLLSDWLKQKDAGIINWMNAGTVATILITILVLDFFGGWLVHFTEHNISWLWRFHIVHHADNNVDVTTGLRHHPVESVLRGLFLLPGLVLAGSPMYAVMIYQTVLVLSTQFTHANICLPAWLDKLIAVVLVSPNVHKVHHHYKQPYTDSNYGAILSVWDRLLGTFKRLEHSKIKYGLDRYYPTEQNENFKVLITLPFKRGIENIENEE